MNIKEYKEKYPGFAEAIKNRTICIKDIYKLRKERQKEAFKIRRQKSIKRLIAYADKLNW